MAQLTKGARVLLDHFDADLADIQRLASELTLADLKSNPYVALDVMEEIATLAQRSLRRLDTDLAPLLQRQERRIDGTEISAIAARIAQIERSLTFLAGSQSSAD
jgi:hypothetical protein